METEYLKGFVGTYSQNKGQGYRRDEKNRGHKVPKGTMHSVNQSHNLNSPSPFKKRWGVNFSKIDGNIGCENFC